MRMALKSVVAGLAITVLSTTLITAQKRPTGRRSISREEPFHSFRLLDSKITLLAQQQESLRTACEAMKAGPQSVPENSPHRKVASNLNLTAAEISRIASGLERLYQTRHQTFGVQMFRTLRVRAQDVRVSVKRVAKAQTRIAADLALKRLDDSIVSLVVQFQAASGGYGATRCSPGTWTCCEPKRSKDLLQSEPIACTWKCASTLEGCTGFVGPRISKP